VSAETFPAVTPSVAAPAAAPSVRPPSAVDVPGVAGQLVSVLSPPRPAAGGTYTVTIALHPENLGEVRATVTAGDDQITVRLMATTGDGDDAIRQAMPQLHAGLSIGGQRTTVTVGGQGGGGSAQWTTGRPAADDHADGGSRSTGPVVVSGKPTVAPSPTVVTATGSVQRRIDVRV